MKRLHVGVIGTGRMGRSHCRIYSTLRYAELIGVHDLDHAMGKAFAEQNQISFYGDVDALLRNVDAVSITTPTPAHHELALHCLKRGVHVLIEKPITETIDQAQEIVAAADASGLVVQVGHIERFNPAYRELKNILEGMTVLVVDFRRLSPFRGSNLDVDVVLDLMIHDLDLALDLAGEAPVDISAHGLTAHDGPIDHAIANLQFKSGLMLNLTASRVTEQKVRSVDTTALGAYVGVDLLNKSVSVHRSTIGEWTDDNRRIHRYRQENIVERIHVPVFEPLYLELQHFVECVMDKKKALVSARDGLAALQLAEQIRTAIGKTLVRRNVAVVS